MNQILALDLLGPACVRVDRNVELPTRKSLALVAYLALAGPTTRAGLASLLWADRIDEDARRNLRQDLHRLHATPVGGWIDAQRDHLSLRKGYSLDVRHFREAIAAERHEAALLLYRGELLAGLELDGATGFMDWLTVERHSLHRGWRTSLAGAAVAREAQGDPQRALDAIRSLLIDDPLQELHHREVMRLQQLCGDRAAALAQFEQCRDILRRELGLEPMPETEALARRIRQGQESQVQRPIVQATPADLHDRAGTPFPPDSAVALEAPLVGRDAAWKQLAQAEGRLALVVGDPGVGKSRLIENFAATHAKTLALRGREISRDTPFYPVAEALLQAYRDDPRWFDLLDPAWRAEVARLVPALADDDPRSDLPNVEARSRFLEGLTTALLTAAGNGIVLFDDLQWFDGASAELVAHIVNRAHRARLVAAARPDELAHNASAVAALTAVEREGKLVRIAIEPLNAPEVRQLVRSMSGATGAEVFSRRLHAATAGNPLFILETLRDLFAAGVLWRDSGTWSTPFDDETEDYRELPISRSVREAVLRRIDRLGEGPRRLLEAASLTGGGFALALIGSCTALSEWETVDALDRATEAAIIIPTASGYRFSHDLIRRSLADAMNPERRSLLHRELARSISRQGGPPAEIAQHLEAGGLPAEAIEHRVRAARLATRIYALTQAMADYDAAIADGASGPEEFAIRSAQVEIYRDLGDDDGRARALAAMACLSCATDHPALAAELAIKRAVRDFENDRHVQGLVDVVQAREALRGRIDDITEAGLLLEIGAMLRALGRVDEARAHLLVALERFRPVSPFKYANCAYWLCQCAIDIGDASGAVDYCRTALDTTQQCGHRRGHALSLYTLADLQRRQGASGDALRTLAHAWEEAREIGSLPLQREFLARLIERHGEQGDFTAVAHWQGELDAVNEGAGQRQA